MTEFSAKRKKRHNFLNLLIIAIIVMPLSRTAAEQPARLLRVGIYAFPPLVSFGTNGNPQGFFIDVLNYMAKKERWNFVYLKGEPAALLESLDSGNIDLMLVTGQDRSQHPEILASKEVLILDWAQLYVTSNSSIRKITDLDGKRIAIQEQGDYLHGNKELENLCHAFMIACELRPYPNHQLSLKAVALHQVDAALVNRLNGAAGAPEHALMTRPIMFKPTDIRIAVSPESQDEDHLLRRIDHNLNELKNDSWSIYHKWNNFLFGKQVDPSIRLSTIVEWLAVLIVAVLGIFLLLHFMRSFITRQTRDLARKEAQYRGFFERASTPLLVCNGSQLIRQVIQLRKLGIKELETYFDNRPNELKKWLGQIRITKVNAAALRLLEVHSQEALQKWLPDILPPSSLKMIKNVLINSHDSEEFSREIQLMTPERHLILAIISFPIIARGKAAYNVPVSIVRVTPPAAGVIERT
ncbi:MAG: transporter substrate-binding domain-containing protein [Candidatus Thiodiazotropha sp.]